MHAWIIHDVNLAAALVCSARPWIVIGLSGHLPSHSRYTQAMRLHPIFSPSPWLMLGFASICCALWRQSSARTEPLSTLLPSPTSRCLSPYPLLVYLSPPSPRIILSVEIYVCSPIGRRWRCADWERPRCLRMTLYPYSTPLIPLYVWAI